MLSKEGERKDRVIQQSKEKALDYEAKLHVKEQQKNCRIGQLKVIHFDEVEQLQLQIRDLNTQKRLMNVEKVLKIKELDIKSKLWKIR